LKAHSDVCVKLAPAWPWTNQKETISQLPFIEKRFPYNEYVQMVGRLEADGWFVRVYVNYEDCV
jgi:hypothetical protein